VRFGRRRIGGRASLLGGLSGYAQEFPQHPWTYKRLDPNKTAALGYEGFWSGRCGYGVFIAIVGQLGYKFPYEMFICFQGGIEDFGSLCGALNGAACAIGLLTTGKGGKLGKEGPRKYLISDLYVWYEKTRLPLYKPAKQNKPTKPIPSSETGSVLCHSTLARWAKKSGFTMDSDERSERCARVTADVAKKTAEILNANLAGKFKFGGLGDHAKYCFKCHEVKMEHGVKTRWTAPSATRALWAISLRTTRNPIESKMLTEPPGPSGGFLLPERTGTHAEPAAYGRPRSFISAAYFSCLFLMDELHMHMPRAIRAPLQ
jgi:hypothetical protein